MHWNTLISSATGFLESVLLQRPVLFLLLLSAFLMMLSVLIQRPARKKSASVPEAGILRRRAEDSSA